MCVIIIADKKHPPKSLLKKAESHNSDGAGIGWIDQKTKSVRWIKGKNFKVEDIKKAIKKHNIQFPYIIHFRITSRGSTCDQLSHPFPLTEGNKNRSKGSDKEGLLFHNGDYDGYTRDLKLVYSSFRENIPDEKMSDSRAMSLIASSKKLGLGYLRTINQSQKIAILTPKGIKRYGSNWAKVEKFTCSNDYFDWTYDSCEGNITSFDDGYEFLNDSDYKEEIDQQKEITTYSKCNKSAIKPKSENTQKQLIFKNAHKNIKVENMVKCNLLENCMCKDCIKEAYDECLGHDKINCFCVNCLKVEKYEELIYDTTSKKNNTITAKIIENEKKIIEETRKNEAQDEINEISDNLGKIKSREYVNYP